MDEVQRVLNSQEQFVLEDSFNVQVHYAKPPAGKGKTLLKDQLLKKRCVLQITNSDDICMVRALVVAQAFADGGDYRKLHQRKKVQTKAARDLITKAGLPLREYSIADLPDLEKVSNEYIPVFADRFCI
jgi:hypothetical protein